MTTVFHSTAPPWFDKVSDLRPGQKRRIGDGLMASFNGRAYHLWDFREKEGEVFEPQLTLEQRIAVHKAMYEAQDAAYRNPEFPGGMTAPKDWPVPARVWLYSAALNNVDIAGIGAVWHADLQRVVLPLQMLDGSTGWIARRIEPGPDASPKYLFPQGMKRGGGAFVRGWGLPGYEQPLVITEDILSSHRIAADSDLDSVSALGTSLDRDAIVLIAAKWKTVFLWLDPDYYGQLGARKIGSDLQQLGVRVVNIKSEVDPKNHTPDEIRSYIASAGPPVSGGANQ